MSPTADPPRMRKVQPFLVSSELSDALDAAIASTTAPMLPRVTISCVARELLVLGCEVLEAELRSTCTVRWTALHPTRGPRRPEERADPNDPDDAYHQLSPIALPEALINRLHDLTWHVATATRAKVSIATVMREALARGCVERERLYRETETFLRNQAMLRADSGFPLATRLAILTSGFSAAMPAGWPPARKRRASKTPKPRAAKVGQPTAGTPAAGQSRARTPRRKSTTRRVAGADDDDGGGDGDGRHYGHQLFASGACTAHCARAA